MGISVHGATNNIENRQRKATFIFIRLLLFWPNCSCASYAGNFCVNIELAQKKYAPVHKESWMRDWGRKIGNKRWGAFMSVQYITSALKWSGQRRGNTTPLSACKTNRLAQHVHAHICAHVLDKALLQRQNRQLNEFCAFFSGFGS